MTNKKEQNEVKSAVQRKKEQVTFRKNWAQALVDKIQEWCLNHGNLAPTRIKSDLNISDSTWRALMGYKRIVERSDETLYARIYLWTGLEEADPRNIPARPVVTPTGKYSETVLTWSDDQLKEWLKSNEAMGLADRLLQEGRSLPESLTDLQKVKQQKIRAMSQTEVRDESAIPEEVKAEGMPELSSLIQSTFGAMMGQYIDWFVWAITNQIGDNLEPRIINVIKKELRSGMLPGVIAPEEWERMHEIPDFIELSELMLSHLQPVINGTPADREKWFQTYKDVVRDIYVYLNILMQRPADAREASLEGYFRNKALGVEQ